MHTQASAVAASARHIMRRARHGATGQTQVACWHCCGARGSDQVSDEMDYYGVEVDAKIKFIARVNTCKKNEYESMICRGDAYVCILSTRMAKGNVHR